MAIDQEWARRVAAALDMLAEVYEVSLTEIRVAAYIESLSDLRASALEAGANMIRDTSKWFPKPIEWREAAERWEIKEAERRRAARENSRPLALPGPGMGPVSREKVLTDVRAIREQFKYLVNRPLEDRPHNQPARNTDQPEHQTKQGRT